ncbi:MAG TPA: ABC transporter ATP-binding protein [Actinomycetota bacterium]|jgi:spermidine/putrescine transport system ATP-binding protein|nr:ABC transporter ATP-binding protein [Actinomycetota bacterium]
MSANGDITIDASREGEIEVERVTKRFGDVTAVDDISITIPGGEFFSMLGPSGCGKTTTLRMIAGFETPDEGRILLQGAPVTHVPPAKRNVNMVFQAYGLFPHMTVSENIAFGPKIKKLSRAETSERLTEILRVVRLEGYEDRRPGQLSGGQQQRVALGRALINRPAALLLDEPLGALDLKLRKEMQLELKDLQQRTGTTFVYVTHDQEEAMTMSDRIAVMNGGVVEQLATPRELYQRPASAFVAGFIGTSNLIELRVDRREDGLLVMDVGEGERILAVQPDAGAGAADRVTITVRPEWIKLVSGDAGPRASHVGGTVIDVVYLGSVTQLIVLLRTGEKLTVHRLNDEVGSTDPRPGEQVTLHWAAEHSYVVGSSPESDTTANDTEATARAGA